MLLLRSKLTEILIQLVSQMASRVRTNEKRARKKEDIGEGSGGSSIILGVRTVDIDLEVGQACFLE